MEKKEIKTTEHHEEISRKEALKKMSTYGKYAALTALGTYLILSPEKAQAQSGPLDGIIPGADTGTAF
tara:strand:+ start:5213 stop:5416 length:204 start_codon:yes stop_codon:yes gene_type:complete